MGNEDHTIVLYCAQAEVVLKTLERDGVCFSKRAYVEQKYQESAPVFVAAYGWFVQEAEKYLPRPAGAEYPYWAFADLYSVDQSGDSHVLRLRVPREEALFFDMYDWTKVLCHEYMGESQAEEARFRQKLADYGVRRGSDVATTNFYPDLKRELQQSWQRLFRYHEKIKAGMPTEVKVIQAALWQIKKEWII